jgi:beta-barrel assembly-enhancing protease
MHNVHTGCTTWEGYYLDGQSAVRRRATVSLWPSGIVFSTEDGAAHSWPYSALRQPQGTSADRPVQLERKEEIPEILVVPHPAFLTVLQQMAPRFATRLTRAVSRRWRRLRTGIAAVSALSIVAALYLWGIPIVSALMAAHIPVSWEERLGREVVAQLAPREQQCIDPERLHLLNELLATLTVPLPSQPYTLRIIVVDDPMVNALAAPGGYITLFRGLLEHTKSAEELAGVLAHEVQHIVQRHVSRQLLEHTSTGLLLAAVTGDVSGTVVFGLEGAVCSAHSSTAATTRQRPTWQVCASWSLRGLIQRAWSGCLRACRSKSSIRPHCCSISPLTRARHNVSPPLPPWPVKPLARP